MRTTRSSTSLQVMRIIDTRYVSCSGRAWWRPKVGCRMSQHRARVPPLAHVILSSRVQFWMGQRSISTCGLDHGGPNLLSPGWTSLAQPPKLAQLPRAGCRPSNWRAAEGTSEVTENQRWDEARSSGPCLTSFPLTPSLRGTSASRSQDCPSQGRRETRSIPPDKRTNSLTS